MKKALLATVIVSAIALNAPAASATPYTSLVIKAIQSSLSETSSNLKTWLAGEHQIEESLGAMYIAQINRANINPATAAAEQAAIKVTWAADVAAIDSIYEPFEFQMVAQIELATDALLAAKRASKDPSQFDLAFNTALAFDYNRAALQKILKSASPNSFPNAKQLATSAESISKSYSFAAAKKLNSQVGAAFTKRAEFKNKLLDAKALYSDISF